MTPSQRRETKEPYSPYNMRHRHAAAPPKQKEKLKAPTFSDTSSMVTLLVSHNGAQKKFSIYREYAVFYSPVLRTALESVDTAFEEGETKTFMLEDIAPEAVRLFVQWLYTHKFDGLLDERLLAEDENDEDWPENAVIDAKTDTSSQISSQSAESRRSSVARNPSTSPRPSVQFLPEEQQDFYRNDASFYVQYDPWDMYGEPVLDGPDPIFGQRGLRVRPKIPLRMDPPNFMPVSNYPYISMHPPSLPPTFSHPQHFRSPSVYSFIGASNSLSWLDSYSDYTDSDQIDAEGDEVSMDETQGDDQSISTNSDSAEEDEDEDDEKEMESVSEGNESGRATSTTLGSIPNDENSDGDTIDGTRVDSPGFSQREEDEMTQFADSGSTGDEKSMPVNTDKKEEGSPPKVKEVQNTLVYLYLLARKLAIPTLQNLAIDTLHRYYLRYQTVPVGMLFHVYETVMPGDPLRKWYVDVCRDAFEGQWVIQNSHEFPHEMLAEVLAAVNSEKGVAEWKTVEASKRYHLMDAGDV